MVLHSESYNEITIISLTLYNDRPAFLSPANSVTLKPISSMLSLSGRAFSR